MNNEFYNTPTLNQWHAINEIISRFINAAKKSRKETAFQDAERKGMDAVQKYCRDNHIGTLGSHMVHAQQRFIEEL